MNRRGLLPIAAALLATAALAGCGETGSPSGGDGDDAASWASDPEALESLLEGVGRMRRFEFELAEASFAEAMAKRPESRIARRNHAIAILNQSEPGAQERAIEQLDAMMGAWLESSGGGAARDLSSQYAKALALLYLGRSGEARDLFIDSANRVPNDAYAAFFAGQCLELEGRHEEALAWYERSIELDEYLRSPLLGAQRCLARLGRDAEGDALLARFLALAENPRGKLAEFKYTRMGTLGEVMAVEGIGSSSPPPAGPLFADPSPMPVAGLRPDASTTMLPAADLNRDGVLDFVAISRRPGEDPIASLAMSTVAEDRSASWRLVPFAAGPAVGEPDAGFGLGPATLLWADFDNDGRTDVAVGPADGTPPFWWRQRDGLQWSRESFGSRPPAAASGSQREAGEGDDPNGPRTSAGVRLLAAADFDHDGDVDLLASGAEGTRLILNRRDGDGERATTWSHRPLTGSLADAASAALGDFDGDGDLDLMLLAADAPAEVWINDLLWSWRRDERFRPLEAAQPVEAVWFRDDDSGRPMLAALAGDGDGRELAIWSLGPGTATRLPIAGEAAAIPGGLSLAAIDLAGSGRLNLVVARPLGADSIGLEVHDARGNRIESIAALPAAASLAVPDARGPVLLLGGADGPPQWRDAGAGRMPFAAIWFSGRTDPSQQMRSNESGIGTRGDARTIGAWQSRTLLPWRSGSPGQPLEPVLFGLGGGQRIEWLSVEWPDGVLQGELDLPPGTATIVETQRQISSCPVIFAWTGDRFEFLTDTLGVGGIGFLADIREEPDGSLTPVYPTSRPWERVKLGPEAMLSPREGRFEIRLGEPMEEACYLDAARLVAWELPPGWSMTLDERMGIGGPPPTGKALFFRHAMPVARASYADGSDATEALREADFVAADPGSADSRFIGRTAEEWVLEFEFPAPIDSRAGEAVLVMDGWVEYPYSSIAFAMWQAKATPAAPTLEALDPRSGEWVTVVEQYGYPAGMPRESAFPIPLGSLPPGCTTLRLRSTNEVYIDRLRLAWCEPCPEARRVEMPLARGEVAASGFARRVPKPQRRPYYDPSQPWPLWDVRLQPGFYTAFGECTPLLAEIDDAVAIFGGGEEIRLEFEDRRGPLEEGWRRIWVLEFEGWCKDMDPYTGGGATLDPLPLRDGQATTPRREELHRRFNTRFAGGR